MKILLNKKEQIFEDKNSITVSELLKIMKYSFPMIIVRVNGSLVKKEDYDSTTVKDGDDVSAFHLISGG